jgi:hypothetical protein
MSAPACDPARKPGFASSVRGALVLALAASLLAASSPGTASAEPRSAITPTFVWSPVYLQNVALPAKPCTRDWRRRARCRPDHANLFTLWNRWPTRFYAQVRSTLRQGGLDPHDCGCIAGALQVRMTLWAKRPDVRQRGMETAPGSNLLRAMLRACAGSALRSMWVSSPATIAYLAAVNRISWDDVKAFFLASAAACAIGAAKVYVNGGVS